MPINIPRLTSPIELSEYAPELAGVRVYVWVNLPKAKYLEYLALMMEIGETPDDTPAMTTLGERLVKALAELWSQHKDAATHIDEAGVLKLVQDKDTDPNLYPWLVNETYTRLIGHRDASKKK